MNDKNVYFMIRLQKNESIVGLSTIHNAYLRMNPKVKNVERISQGSADPETPWAKARRFLICTYLYFVVNVNWITYL